MYAGLAAAFLASILGQAAPSVTAAQPSDVRASVVRITSIRHYPDLYKPWSKLAPAELVGTGLIIEGGRILTNAHMVSHSASILVQPWQSSAKYLARVVAIAPGIDLAVLQPEDERAFSRSPQAPLVDRLPKVGDPASAYGFPVGGRDLSVTEGVVSRIEYSDYYYESTGLRIQVDAALNPGNSGGPALSRGNVVGIVFSGIREAENIGYVIPNQEILAFLSDIEDGTYDGRPEALERSQPFDNPALRAMLRAGDDVTGLVVQEPWSSDAAYPLLQWDVITRIGDHPVDNDGFVDVGDNLRIACDYLVPRLAAGGIVPVTVWRRGASVQVDAPVYSSPQRLVRYLADEQPSYLICGPLVFTPLYQELAERLDADSLIWTSSAIAARRRDRRTAEEQELVVVPCPLLPHRIASGYEVLYPMVLAKLNGDKVRSLRHLGERIRDLSEEYLVFEWADSSTQAMVFRRSEILQATGEILESNGIRAACSSDLAGLWPPGGR